MMQQPRIRDEEDEKPLDPAVERVRRKLARFVAINLGILFAAIMVVVVALFYKGFFTPASTDTEAGFAPRQGISLQSGTRILSQSISGARLSLHVEEPSGRQAILIYDIATDALATTVPISLR